ncbi:MAG: 5-Nucleotidase domain protein [Paenibacillus sp.]|nr:5-Nucleotidase domain protein [Paenibacillus sp.]
MRRKKWWTSAVISACLLFTSVNAVSAADNAAAEPTDKLAPPAAGTKSSITILHTNDIHSRAEESKDNIGYAKLSSLVKQQKAGNPNTLLIDAGDTLHGQTFANLVRGESILRTLNAVGYDVMTPGNHDFNYGYQRLVELSSMAKFPIVSANVKKADGTRLLKPYVIKEVAGIRIGIFGLTTPETAYKTHPNNVAGITFADPAAEAKAIVGELKGKVDMIIANAHLGIDKSSIDTSIKVAEQVPDIDLIIDGHSHSALDNGMMVGKVLIAQTGEYGKNIGKIELNFDGTKLTGKTAGLINRTAAESIPADPAVLDLINGIKKEQSALLAQEVGSTAVKLVGDREVVRKGESNLGNLIADAMLSETGADVSITNGGGIRDSIPAGTITKGQVITVLPFGNYIQTKKVKGSSIKAALENGVSAYPESLGAFPHIGGMTFTFDPGKPAGQRVDTVAVRGLPLDINKEYTLATNDFMAAGGDQYTMFKDYPLAGDFSSLEESLISYIQKTGGVQSEVEGRIMAKSSEASTSTPVPAAVTQAKSESQKAANVYIVMPGDSLWKISLKYGTTWQQLQKMNGLSNPNLIYPGQEITVPAS